MINLDELSVHDLILEDEYVTMESSIRKEMVRKLERHIAHKFLRFPSSGFSHQNAGMFFEEEIQQFLEMFYTKD